VAIEEVMDGNFSEVAACGTAVVVTPVNKIVYMNRVAQISEGLDVGPVTRKLYNRVRGIQNGEAEDKFGWMIEV
jgi:branched-chain amino acid aminotransferase